MSSDLSALSWQAEEGAAEPSKHSGIPDAFPNASSQRFVASWQPYASLYATKPSSLSLEGYYTSLNALPQCNRFSEVTTPSHRMEGLAAAGQYLSGRSDATSVSQTSLDGAPSSEDPRTPMSSGSCSLGRPRPPECLDITEYPQGHGTRLSGILSYESSFDLSCIDPRLLSWDTHATPLGFGPESSQSVADSAEEPCQQPLRAGDVFDDEGKGVSYLIERDGHLWPDTHSTIGMVGANLSAREPVYPHAWPYGFGCPLYDGSKSKRHKEHLAEPSNGGRTPVPEQSRPSAGRKRPKRGTINSIHPIAGQTQLGSASRDLHVGTQRKSTIDVAARHEMVLRIKELQAQPDSSPPVSPLPGLTSLQSQPNGPKSFTVFEKEMIDAEWFTRFNANSSALAANTDAVQMLYWDEKARRGQKPPVDIARQRGLTPKQYAATIWDECPVDEIQEPKGPWDEEDNASAEGNGSPVHGNDSENDVETAASPVIHVRHASGSKSSKVSKHKRKLPHQQCLPNKRSSLALGKENTRIVGALARLAQREASASDEDQGHEHPKTEEKEASRNNCRPPPGEIRVCHEQQIHIPDHVLARRKNPIVSYAAPSSVDVRLLGTLAVTTMECLKFLPNHYVWRGYRMRLHGNNWGAAHMAQAILQARDLPDERLETNLSSTISKSYQDLTKFKKKNGSANPRIPVTDFSCANWTPPTLSGWNKRLIDYYVKDLATGVRRANFPKHVDDRGPLTYAIEYVLDHPDWDWIMISDLAWFIPLKGLHRYALRAGPGVPNRDVSALQRHRQALEDFRKSHRWL